MPQSACQTVWRYETVFTGVVTEVTDSDVLILESGKRSGSRFPKWQVTFKISEQFTGPNADKKEITIATGPSTCDYPFKRGVEYVVYGYRNPDGRITTNICSPTKPVEFATEELKYLRGLRDAPEFGRIHIVAYDANQPWTTHGPLGMFGVKVSLKGPNVRKQADTDSEGRATFVDLPPGEYSVSAAFYGYTLNQPLAPVKLHAKGCANVELPLQLDRVVAGKVVSRDGRPMQDVLIEAVPARPRSENDTPFPVDSGATDANGRYELRNLRAGDYYLGISLGHTPTKENPYARWFYPGTEDPRAAVLIHIIEKPERQTFDFAAPDPQKHRVIEGVVIWPDGRPASGAEIIREDPRWPSMVSLAVTTDSAGQFKIEGFDGTSYRIHANMRVENYVSAEPVTIEPGSNTATVRLVLTRQGHSMAGSIDKAYENWRQGRGLQ